MLQIFEERDEVMKGSLQIRFSEQGGFGLTEAQVFIEIFQNQICLGE